MLTPVRLNGHSRFKTLDAASGIAIQVRITLAQLSLAVTAVFARIGQVGDTLDITPAAAADGPSEAIVMHTVELIYWTAIVAMTAAVILFPRPAVFWSFGASQPFVLARVRPVGPSRFRSAVD